MAKQVTCNECINFMRSGPCPERVFPACSVEGCNCVISHTLSTKCPLHHFEGLKCRSCNDKPVQRLTHNITSWLCGSEECKKKYDDILKEKLKNIQEDD
jgi:hypothetical protein